MLYNAAAWINIGFAVIFAILQLLLTLGAPLGEVVLGGNYKRLSAKMRFVSGFFSLAFTVSALSYLQKVGIIVPLFPKVFADVWVIAHTVFITCAIFSNAFLTKSKKEKYSMTPISIICSISSIYLLFQ